MFCNDEREREREQKSAQNDKKKDVPLRETQARDPPSRGLCRPTSSKTKTHTHTQRKENNGPPCLLSKVKTKNTHPRGKKTNTKRKTRTKQPTKQTQTHLCKLRSHRLPPLLSLRQAHPLFSAALKSARTAYRAQQTLLLREHRRAATKTRLGFVVPCRPCLP